MASLRYPGIEGLEVTEIPTIEATTARPAPAAPVDTAAASARNAARAAGDARAEAAMRNIRATGSPVTPPPAAAAAGEAATAAPASTAGRFSSALRSFPGANAAQQAASRVAGAARATGAALAAPVAAGAAGTQLYDDLTSGGRARTFNQNLGLGGAASAGNVLRAPAGPDWGALPVGSPERAAALQQDLDRARDQAAAIPSAREYAARGLDTLGSIGANALRTANSIGNSLLGVAGFAGNNLDGGRSPQQNVTPVAAPAAAAAPPANPNDNSSYFQFSDGRRVPVASTPPTAGYGTTVATGSPTDDVLQSALRTALTGSTGSRGGASGAVISDDNNSINARFDALARQVTDLHGGKAPGTLARKLMQIEEDRQNALRGEANTDVARSGQAADQRGRDQAAAASLANSLLDYSAANATTAQRAASDRARLRQDQIQTNQTKNLEQLQTYTRALSTDPATGKVDEAKAARLANTMLTNVPGLADGTVDFGTQRQAISEMQAGSDIGDITNQGSQRANSSLPNFSGSQLREPTIGEAFDPNSDVTFGDNARRLVDGLPGVGDSRIVTTSDGRVARWRDLNEDQKRYILRQQGQ